MKIRLERAEPEWFTFREGNKANPDGVQFEIAPHNNEAFTRKRGRIEEPFKKHIRRGTLSKVKEDEILVNAMSGTILLDWTGLVDDDTGQAIPYSDKVAATLLSVYSDIMTFVIEKSMSLAETDQDEVETVGNESPSSSDTNDNLNQVSSI